MQDEINKSVQDESFKRDIAEKFWNQAKAFFHDKERRGEGVIYYSRDVEGVDVGRIFVYNPKPNDGWLHYLREVPRWTKNLVFLTLFLLSFFLN